MNDTWDLSILYKDFDDPRLYRGHGSLGPGHRGSKCPGR